MTNAIRAADAAAAAGLVGGLWRKLKGARILLTGATGFLGGPLVEALLHANQAHGLGASVVTLTRDPVAARRRNPWLANEAVTLIAGDICDFSVPPGGFSHCIHGAAVASTPLTAQDGGQITRTIVEGTRHCLAVAARAGVTEFLYVSSGAVYGRQPTDLPALGEESPQAPLGASAPEQYARAKRVAEELCLAASPRLNTSVARGFAFIGPGIPLDAQYAAGNFIRDALAGGPILIDGDGTAVRSYLYSADAAAWAWTILLSGRKGRVYNVGSPDGVSISELARRIALSAGGLRVEIKGRPTGASPQLYVPSVARAQADLGLRVAVPLSEAVGRTLAWARESRGKAS